MRLHPVGAEARARTESEVRAPRCVRLSHVVGSCSVCGRYGTVVHLVGDERARCLQCCPVCQAGKTASGSASTGPLAVLVAAARRGTAPAGRSLGTAPRLCSRPAGRCLLPQNLWPFPLHPGWRDRPSREPLRDTRLEARVVGKQRRNQERVPPPPPSRRDAAPNQFSPRENLSAGTRQRFPRQEAGTQPRRRRPGSK